jgi:hypothetical protein
VNFRIKQINKNLVNIFRFLFDFDKKLLKNMMTKHGAINANAPIANRGLGAIKNHNNRYKKT